MFRTLRSKLIFSYVGVALLCLLLAVLGTLTLARDYAQREGYTTLQEKWSLVMPLLRTTLAVQNRPNRQATRAILGGIQNAIRNADVRVLLLDPSTLRVVEDTSNRYNAIGQHFIFCLCNRIQYFFFGKMSFINHLTNKINQSGVFRYQALHVA